MKFGLRIPSLNKRIAARTSLKRYVRHSLGIKMPRGAGFITNPKKALYNRVYNRTSFSVGKLPLRRTKKSLGSSSDLSYVFWPAIITIFLFIISWPLGVIYIIYKAIKLKSKVPAKKKVEDEHIEINSPAVIKINNDLVSTFNIPEPTRSLVLVSNEDISKIQSPMIITLNVSINSVSHNIDTTVDDHKASLDADPSLIWTRLPVKVNSDLEEKSMYYPAYSSLSPECRYQYINWLKDVTQDTNLSYVFLYFYGLERHLLIGNYDLAVDEILRLLRYHDKSSFRSYAAHSLIASSVFKKRPDILERAPFVLEDVSDISLYLRLITQKEFIAKDLMELASWVKFQNKRYIKLRPEMFEKELQKIIDDYHRRNGLILSQINDVTYEDQTYFANLSIPEKIRRIRTPQIIKNEQFRKIIFDLLNEVHLNIKNLL
jgi:hypothetical protein